MQVSHDLWPATAQSFTDEFGRIDPEVYDAARRLWPLSQSLIQQTSHDEAIAHSMLMKACAVVTQRQQQTAEEITNLPAYLAQTWRHLLFAESRKELRHDEIKEAHAASFSDVIDPLAKLDEAILLDEITRQMDDWTREVFQLRVIGFEFEEIAMAKQSNSHALRVRFNRKINQLLNKLHLIKD